MIDSQPTPSRRVRIASHVTQSRFLHVEDALGIGKIRLFAGNYRRGQGMNSHAYHFIDLADARVIFAVLSRGEPSFSYREYKGTPPQTRPERSRRNGSGAVSRVLSIAVRGDNVYVELKSGPGKPTATGAITPNGKPQAEVNVGFKLYEAQRLAATVLAYIQAWDVHRIMIHQQLVSQPAPYLLTATEAANGGTGMPTTVASEPLAVALAADPHAAAGNGNRPVTRKAPMPRANGGQVAVPPHPAVSLAISPEVVATAEAIYGPGGLRYGDGTAVDAGNLAEVQAFQRFAAEKQDTPASRASLQAYYREHMAA